MLDLDAIEARAEAAIPGPWEVHGVINVALFGKDGANIAQASRLHLDGPSARHCTPDCHSTDLEQEAANAGFIAHARQDIPAMASEIRKLRKSCETMAVALGFIRYYTDTSREGFERADSGLRDYARDLNGTATKALASYRKEFPKS